MLSYGQGSDRVELFHVHAIDLLRDGKDCEENTTVTTYGKETNR